MHLRIHLPQWVGLVCDSSPSLSFFLKDLFIYLLLAVLSFRCWVWCVILLHLFLSFLKIYLFTYFWLCWAFVAVWRLFSSCGERGLLWVVVHGLLNAVASLVAAHGLCGCGTWPYLLCGMWHLPREGTEPMSPALAGGFLTIGPLGQPSSVFLLGSFISSLGISLSTFGDLRLLQG